MEAFELRLWDGRLGRWLTVDPYHEFHSPYVGMGNNPVGLIDPDGGQTDHEYKMENGVKTKLSNKGGELFDIIHHIDGKYAGQTEFNYKGNSIFSNATDFISGYSKRESNIDYKDIFSEWKNGTGPEKSFFDYNHPMVDDMKNSFIAYEARDLYINSKDKKGLGNSNFGISGILRSSNNMTEQMVGSGNFSYYQVGESVIFMIMDSKSKTSFYYHFPWIKNRKRNTIVNYYCKECKKSISYRYDDKEANTYQTYIWIESIKELKEKHRLYEYNHETFD